jgi:hypothetical protein
MSVIANPPFPSYFDSDGSPLEDGYIYFGAANQNPETNPITVYWDSAYTQPALQPIRTSGGFTYRAGTPANIYVSTDFSITVRDKNRRLVYSKLLSEGQTTAEVNLQYSTQAITATAAQTVFGLSTAYTPGNNSLAVYHNGSRLIVGQDYTETTSTSITLSIGATAGDVLQFVTATPINPSSLGAAAVAYVPAGAGAVATNVQAKLRETVSVKDFGAVGDWNATSQTGTDDTAAVQAAIDYVLTRPDPRNGGARGIFFPPGNYKITSLTIPQTGFGFAFEGAGKDVAQIWADHTDANPAIDCKIEFTRFSNLTLSGSLQATYDPTKWKPVFFRGKLTNNYADIDAKFENCTLFNFDVFAQVYGRGCLIERCSVVYGSKVIQVQCDASTVFPPSDPYFIWSARTGFRHYEIRDCRFDTVSIGINVSGTAIQKNYINSILITGNNFTGVDRLIQSDDCTIQGANITGNMSTQSFRYGVVDVPNVKRCQDVGNVWQADYDDATIPTNNTQTIEYVWKCLTVDHLVVSGSTIKNLRSGAVRATTSGSNITVSGCSFPNSYEWKGGSTTAYLVESSANISGLNLVCNTFSCRNINGTNYLYNPNVQDSTNTRVLGNVAPWAWGNKAFQNWLPKIFVNGVQTTGTGSFFGRYWLDDNYVVADFAISTTIPEASGTITISIPKPASAEFSSFSPSYAGLGQVIDVTNLKTTVQIDGLRVSASSQSVEIKVSTTTDSTRNNMTIASINAQANPVVLVGAIRYVW